MMQDRAPLYLHDIMALYIFCYCYYYYSYYGMEGEYETAPKLSNGTSLNDLQ